MGDPGCRNNGVGSLVVREVVDIAHDKAMDSGVFVIMELLLENRLDY